MDKMKNLSFTTLFVPILMVIILFITCSLQSEELEEHESGVSPLRMPYRFGKREESLFYWKSKITDEQKEKIKRALKQLRWRSRNPINFNSVGVLKNSYGPEDNSFI